MKIESIQPMAGGGVPPGSTPAEKVDKARKSDALALREDEKKQQQVAPEELLDRIKSLTEDGLYSVRFEMDKDVQNVVIKLVDSESGELIRQIPAEELLGLSKKLRELRGMMVDTTG